MPQWEQKKAIMGTSPWGGHVGNRSLFDYSTGTQRSKQRNVLDYLLNSPVSYRLQNSSDGKLTLPS
jgi:hypothetical protein